MPPPGTMPGMDQATATLRATHTIALELPADAAGDGQPLAPEWVQLIPAGEFTGRDGRGPYTLDAAAVLAAFERGGIDLPNNHQT
ncbi:MAG: phage protease, partial [Rhodocyclaceae bacterium]|nr:phage protease [Rhodocyclaceae bacterium]